MTLNARQSEILARLQSAEFLEVDTLAGEFQIATQTVRKDINRLCEQGLARRVHGGIAPAVTTRNTPFDIRSSTNLSLKQALCAQVSAFVPDGSSVMIGNGTTVTEAARALLNKTSLQVLTNNLSVASVFSQNPACRLRLAEGELRHEELDLIGTETIAFYNRYEADVGLASASGLQESGWVMEFDTEEALVSQAIWANCRTRILIADSSKWSRRALVRTQKLDQIDVFITDGFPSDDLRALTRSMVGQLIEVPQEAPL